MVLNNLKIALTNTLININITDDKIVQISNAHIADAKDKLNLSFDNAVVSLGFINSHDHLDFNLFPSLGNRKYNNYTEWGNYIHQNYKKEINTVLKIPKDLREQWGIYKNLLCGVTTVVNHGKPMQQPTDLITVYENCQSIHSVQFEAKWKLALNNPLKKNKLAAIHCGEGIDDITRNEIDALIKWNLLNRSIVAIHGVAMTKTQAKAFKALVWCPESNYFLLGKTAAINQLKGYVPVLFGSDSTLTGSWNIWEHLRLAKQTNFMTDGELYNTLTLNAAAIWGINSGEIAKGRDADILITKTNKTSFFENDPSDVLMVIHKGKISLFDEELYPQLKPIDLSAYSKIYVDNTCKYVKGNLPALINKIKTYCPETIFPVL